MGKSQNLHLHFSPAPRLPPTPELLSAPPPILRATWPSTSCDISPGSDEITARRQKAGLRSVFTLNIQPDQTLPIYQKVNIKHFMFNNYELLRPDGGTVTNVSYYLSN